MYKIDWIKNDITDRYEAYFDRPSVRMPVGYIEVYNGRFITKGPCGIIWNYEGTETLEEAKDNLVEMLMQGAVRHYQKVAIKQRTKNPNLDLTIRREIENATKKARKT